MYPWHINLTKPKTSIEVGITSIIGQHNHDSIIPDIQIDLYNAIQKFKSPLTNRNGDAQNMINKLLKLKDQEPGWIIHIRLDSHNNRLVGLFWMFPNQHQFVVNNNTKSRLIAQYLSEDKTIKSYEWFLDCFFQTTNNNSPVCLFTNADPALISAVATTNVAG
ncbi:unnamed protein product [Rhizophagus irregularis]|nr:unnamed protein product [Rhizophagus irregularis]